MGSNKNSVAEPPPEFDWILLRQDMDKAVPEMETTKEKMIRKINDNPFVPIGCLLTASALALGLYSMRQGNRIMSQKMMRARIVAQGFTVVALLGGVAMAAATK